MITPDKRANALNAFIAASKAADAHHLGGIAGRLDSLARRLGKFNFPLVAQPLAALLTRPENHPATARIEALIHLAALVCRGTQTPTLAHIREWLNKIMCRDLLTQLEDPVEDVFVSNVATWFGNARLFEGGWPDNDYYVQTCLAALTRLKKRPWAARAQTHVVALLRLSEAVAARADIPRFTLSETPPRQPIKVTAPTVEPCRKRVTFTAEEIFALGFPPGDLNPFVFHPRYAEALAEETLGHTSLERRPLVRIGPLTVVALPTAIGAAIRRYIIEASIQADDLGLLQATVAQAQFGEMYDLGRVAWDIDAVEAPNPTGAAGAIDFIGRFDDGAYVHAVFVPDDLAAAAQEGLQGVHPLSGVIDERIEERTTEIAARPDYCRGLTLVIHGGVGRGFSAGFGKPPPNWQRLGLPLPEFMRLGWDTELSALRAWKLLDQEDALAERHVVISNINGFPNLYAYARRQDFELVPEQMTLGMIALATDFLTPLRHRLRVSLDQHVALGPEKNAWVEVQRETTDAFFTEAQNLPAFVSPRH